MTLLRGGAAGVPSSAIQALNQGAPGSGEDEPGSFRTGRGGDLAAAAERSGAAAGSPAATFCGQLGREAEAGCRAVPPRAAALAAAPIRRCSYTRAAGGVHMALDRDTGITWYGHACFEVRTPGGRRSSSTRGSATREPQAGRRGRPLRRPARHPRPRRPLRRRPSRSRRASGRSGRRSTSSPCGWRACPAAPTRSPA